METKIQFLSEDFQELNSYLEEKSPSILFIIVDENTHEHCLPILLSDLEIDIPFEIIELESGEENKTLETVCNLLTVFAEFEADRNALVINLGGGVITDLGGFAASIYKRGIDFINIPTSLLGMCDASIGGKTGVDLESLKNLVGTFALADSVFANPNFLKTLPQKELISGFAEMLKHGLVDSKNHWENLIQIEEITVDSISAYIKESMMIKQNIINQDFHEKNIRKILNFGHTIGHAVESLFLRSGNPISHGEAVAIGMICETRLSYLENLIDLELSNHIIDKIFNYFPKKNLNFVIDDILALMKNDKKNKNSKVMFSLITSVGNCSYNVECAEKNIKNSIEFYSK
ncbi:3-dehydroquinate synthase [Frigoriflavimonas asaccharolytica]|uniref:3-dehydroquinate synthase n=1 Tax=Frigoriflavimonas asaccharolytica TaxID=2735899 RepID=A0A8J8G8R2_9FLAO|nr:3-dehydroquinate synthase [Frigoriflavimonas asaccharolytica]NRS91559.1 3-dehydroquinate synthase [Frigoriflavimonas asaccharolytica]